MNFLNDSHLTTCFRGISERECQINFISIEIETAERIEKRGVDGCLGIDNNDIVGESKLVQLCLKSVLIEHRLRTLVASVEVDVQMATVSLLRLFLALRRDVNPAAVC